MAERDALFALTRTRPAVALATEAVGQQRDAPPYPAAPASVKRARSVLKALTWRFTATIDTFIISYLVTGKLSLAGAIISIEVVTKLVVYYLHERAWENITWGRMRP